MQSSLPAVCKSRTLTGGLQVRLPPHFVHVRRTAIRLYTMGQPRVGDAAYAALVESLFHERFRIVNTADIVPHLPPSKVWAEHGRQPAAHW